MVQLQASVTKILWYLMAMHGSQMLSAYEKEAVKARDEGGGWISAS